MFTLKVLTRVYHYPPPPTVLWNHRVTGKNDLWSLIPKDLY
jgi:hypothetical protein